MATETPIEENPVVDESKAENATDVVMERVGKVQDKIVGLNEKASEVLAEKAPKLSEVTGKAGDLASKAHERFNEVTDKRKEKAGDVFGNLAERGKKFAQKAGEMNRKFTSGLIDAWKSKRGETDEVAASADAAEDVADETSEAKAQS
ncbi:MAG: hypothetical protein R2770_06085 [Acidimicrobiales bacterium]|nr:hypothetical protein [Acidimicrobiales bacterium]